jgi:hypothetical protein
MSENKLSSELLAAAFRYRPERIYLRKASKKIYKTIPTGQGIASLSLGMATECII